MSHVMVLTLDDVLLSHVSYHRYSQLLADGEEDDADLLDKVSLSVYVYVLHVRIYILLSLSLLAVCYVLSIS